MGKLSLSALCLALTGCASTGFPDVVEARDLFSSYGAPKIDRVRDAGLVRLPLLGAWKGMSDGFASPGELLVIEGDNFGRQPTVTVGGRATSIVARGEGGAIIARVPTGVLTGRQLVAVSSQKGRATKEIELRRLAVVVHGDQIYFLTVDKQGVRPFAQPIPLLGAQLLRLSGDGGAAYVVAKRPEGDRLAVIDLAQAQPRLVREIPLSHRVTQLASAEDAGVLALVGEGKLTLAQAHFPLQPAPFAALELPKEVRAPRAIELSPDGKVLAVLLGEGNRLVALDVDPLPSVRVISVVDLLPGERLSLVRDLAFSSDGETLWVVSGNNAQTLPALQPTRLTAVRLLAGANEGAKMEGGERPTAPKEAKSSRLLSLWRTQSVPGAAAPIRLAIARGQPLASGTTIRMPPEKAAVFVTSVKDSLFQLSDVSLDTKEGARSFGKLWQAPPPGMMVRGEINGGGGPMFTSTQLLSDLDLTPDSQWVVATAARVAPAPSTGGLAIEFGVVASAIWGAGTPAYLSLGPLAARELKPPFSIGEIRIQP